MRINRSADMSTQRKNPVNTKVDKGVPVNTLNHGILFKLHKSRKHAYIILTPLTPLLYSKLGYTLFFILLLKNIDCGYSLEPPRRVGSNEYL